MFCQLPELPFPASFDLQIPGFSLSKVVGQQFRMMITHWIVADSRSQEESQGINSALMDQLIERMLTVGTWLTPNDWASLVINSITVTINIFTVRFHVALLAGVSSKTVHVLVIQQDRF